MTTVQLKERFVVFRCVLASLYETLSLRPLVRWLVGHSFVKFDEQWPLWILGGRRDKEEGGARRKERRGGRSDEEEGVRRRVKK